MAVWRHHCGWWNMSPDSLVEYLGRPRRRDGLVRSGRVGRSADGAHQNVVGIARTGVTLDLLAIICDQLERHLGRLSDPDRALNNLDRFFLRDAQPFGVGGAVGPRPGRDADSASNLLHQPIPRRPAHPRSREL